MWATALSSTLLLSASAAYASAVDDAVNLFEAICIESPDSLAAAAQRSISSGWRKNEALSGQESTSPAQTIDTDTWDILGASFTGQLAISVIEDRRRALQLCAITLYHFDDATLETALAARLNLGAPSHRTINGTTLQSTWSGDKMTLGVWYLAQPLTSGPGVQIGIAKHQRSGQ